MSESENPWIEMACRVVRTVLARKGIGYAQLSVGLAAFGITEGEKALAARVSRGRISLAMFLQVAQVANAKLPPLWEIAQNTPDPWEDRAFHVVSCELKRHPTVSLADLAQRIQTLGADYSEKTLVARMSSGTLSLATFLQCLVALGSLSLECFIDYEDLVLAAKACSTSPDGNAVNLANKR